MGVEERRVQHYASQWGINDEKRSHPFPLGTHCLLGGRDNKTNAQTSLITSCNKFNERKTRGVMRGNNEGIGIMKEIGCSQRLGPEGTGRD